MTVRSPFLFLGGHAIVDFLNTEMISDGKAVDALPDIEALRNWLVQADLASKRAGLTLSPSILHDVKQLRRRIRAVIEAVAAGKKPQPGDAAAIDRELRRGTGSLALRRDGSGFVFGFEPSKEGGADPRFIIARTAAEFLSGADPSRVRRCQGPRCILLYYDLTKSGTRRWCSMASCGNRQKAAAHYRRVKRGEV
jgi:predicted RNA-binding Zn ribbon-like protein